MVLDSRAELDKKDEATIRTIFARHPFEARFNYEHVESTCEALLWIADAAAWCFGAGGAWRRRMDPILGAVSDLD